MRLLSRSLFALGVLLGVGLTSVRADECPLSLERLRKLNECELTRLFEQASPGPIPVGAAKGRVLLMTGAKFPRLKANLACTVWKGKQFHDDGGLINQFVGFQALRASVEMGTSWHDEKPCIVILYPPGTPLFGNVRDELREIGPGLYLGRFYERCPCPRLLGYFALQFDGCK